MRFEHLFKFHQLYQQLFLCLLILRFWSAKLTRFSTFSKHNMISLHEQSLTGIFLTNSFHKMNFKKYQSKSFTLALRKCQLLILLKRLTSVCSYLAFFSDNKSMYSFELQHDFLTRHMLEMEGYFSLETDSSEGITSVSSSPFREKKEITFELKYKPENVK